MDSEINAVYVLNDEYNDDCLKFTNKIKSAFYNIAREFVYIGFLLAECDYYETYKEWGYSSIHEYASDRLGLKKSSTYNFINVCKAFTEPTECMPCSYFMKDKYENFNYSQLVEMLSMNDKQRSQVTPDMTVKQIREVKKAADVTDDSRRLENSQAEAPVPEVLEEPEPELVSYPGYDLLISLKSDLHALFKSIEEAYLDIDKNIDFDLFDMVFGYLKSNDYIICKKVNKKPKNRFALK